MDLKLARDFLKGHKMCVVSTVGDDAPESALVAFVEDEQLNLYFQTKSFTRKAANLKSNPKVALVIGWDMSELKTLQYEGEAVLLRAPEEIDTAKQLFVDKDSPAKDHVEKADVNIYKVTPTWLRLSDYSKGLPEIAEHTF